MSLAEQLQRASLAEFEDRRMFRDVALSAPVGSPSSAALDVQEGAIDYAHISPAEWPWRNFQPIETACKTTGLVPMQSRGFHITMDALQATRDEIQEAIFLTNMYRSLLENRRVGGGKNSQHLIACAADIVLGGRNIVEFEAILRKNGFNGIGRYPSRGFIHADTRAKRATWNG